MKSIFSALLLLLLSSSSGWALPSDCSGSLPFGAPSINAAKPTEICHPGYVAAVDPTLLVPRWVVYRLTGDHVTGCYARKASFHAEDQLPPGRRQEPADYNSSGYDRGHQAPADDFAWDPNEMADSFSMANVAPQAPGLNRGEWEHLEETIRAWALEKGELIVYVGPIFHGHTETIGENQVGVPSAFWKIVIDPNQKKALAFIMPQKTIPKGDLRPWQTSISDVEQQSGINLHLPSWLKPNEKPSIWPASINGLRKEKKSSCHR